MRSAMSEFTVAKVLYESGHEITPEIGVATGHSIDFRADRNGSGTLVEVTRPRPPDRRAASSPVTSVRETAETKTNGQLQAHQGGVTLFVDCSSFDDDEWATIRKERPGVRHKPAVVFRVRPGEPVEGYTKGSVPLSLPDGVETN